MGRPGTTTEDLGEARTSIAITVVSGKREIPFVIDELSETGGRIHGELLLTVGQRIRIMLQDKAGVAHAIDAEIIRVHNANLLNDEADVRFISLPDAARDVLAPLMRARGESAGENFDHEEEQPTQRRSAPLLPTLEDLDPPTFRKDKPK